jgi:hypothetical protein
MPYEGEFAAYKPLQRIAETERVRNLLKKSRIWLPNTIACEAEPTSPPPCTQPLPRFVVAIDGSRAEVDVKNGYPGAKVGYCTVASVLLDLAKITELDQARPVDPREFRKTEEASTLDAAFPGCNVITRTHTSAKESFREALYENFHDVVIDLEDGKSLLDTYEAIFENHKSEIKCPYAEQHDCLEHIKISKGIGPCACPEKRPVYSTDALRIHERFYDNASNGEALGEITQVWERVLLVHLLRWFERRDLLGKISKMAFLLDGPLAMFGHPAWLSPIFKSELKRLNKKVRALTNQDLLIFGVEKTGAFVTHFEEIDRTATGAPFFPNATYALLSDKYIKERIIFSTSDKPYGQATYFGRKFFYKSKSGARIVATMAILDDSQDQADDSDVSRYANFGAICALLDKVVSSRFPNAVGPIISAHSYAAIPLTLGTKVLQQLAKALMKNE